MITYRRGVTCEISAYFVESDDEVVLAHPWSAIATAHVYDANPNPRVLSAEHAVLAGAVMMVVEGHATGRTEGGAMEAALRALLLQLDARAANSPDSSSSEGS